MSNISRAKKVLLLSFGKVFNTLAFLVSGIIAARILTKHDYATLKQTFVVYSTFAPLLGLGLGSVPYYFLPKENNKKSVIINNMTLLFFMGMLFTLFLLFGGYKLIAHYFNNKDLETILKWMIPYPIYTMPVVNTLKEAIYNRSKYIDKINNIFSYQKFSLNYQLENFKRLFFNDN